MGRAVVAAAGVRSGQRVLDVGAGTGNATLPAAATGAQVVGTDIAPQLLAVGERAARARGLDVSWQLADAQDLPFDDDSFDVVLSCVGAMFAPDQRATARELLRVCRPGGTVALGNWTPGGAAGVLRVPRPLPAPDAGPPPTAWGAGARGRAVRRGRPDHRDVRPGRGLHRPPGRAVAYYREHFAPSS